MTCVKTEEKYSFKLQETEETTRLSHITRSLSSGDKKLLFNNKNELLEYVLNENNFTLQEIFERMKKSKSNNAMREKLTTNCIQNFLEMNSSAAVLTAEQNDLLLRNFEDISKLMKSNKFLKHNFVKLLSQNHLNESLLDHALQENPLKLVLEKIGLPKIVNFVIHKTNSSQNEEDNFCINKMNRILIHKLISSTHSVLFENNEIESLLRVLFQFKPKMEIIEIVQEFIRSLLQIH